MSETTTSLLLLPAPPSELNEHTIDAAYKPPLTQALASASRHSHSILDIAVLCSSSLDESPGLRNQSYPLYQSVLAGIYRLCCHICAERGIDPVKPGYVDFRVLLITSKDAAGLSRSVKVSQGPVYSLESLALAGKQWGVVYCTEGEAAEDFLRQFTLIRRGSATKPQLRSFTIEKVPGGASIKILAPRSEMSKVQPRQNKVVAVGGTFDNLHEGHKLLLSCTALVLEPPTGVEPAHRRVVIGITGDQLLVNKKFAEMLESWEERQEASFRFVHSIISLHTSGADIEKVETRNDPGPNGKAVVYHLAGALTIECVEIQDPFGPTITDEAVDALVVSAETRSGGKAVNDKRAEKGWSALEVFEVDVLGPSGSSDLQDKISSTEKRKRRLEAQSGKL